jgi:hypothetical protein
MGRASGDVWIEEEDAGEKIWRSRQNMAPYTRLIHRFG